MKMAFTNDAEFQDDFRKLGRDATAGFEPGGSPSNPFKYASSENLELVSKGLDEEEDLEDEDELEDDEDDDELEDDDVEDEDDDEEDDDDFEDDEDEDIDEDDEDDEDEDLEDDDVEPITARLGQRKK
jgi:hypothetical protein